MFSRSLLSFALAASFIATARATCMHGTTLMRRDDGDAIPVPKFSYGGETGPMNWASLDPEWKACRSSKMQSPQDLTDTIKFADAPPQIHWPNVDKADFENLYTTVEVMVPGGGLVFNNVTYNLKQFHFHASSEHRINNEVFPLEAHFVSQAADESILVTAVLFEITEDGATTDLLTSVTQNIAAIAKGGSKTETGPLNFGPIVQAVTSKPLYSYTGSLTAPPCKEGVHFLILSEPQPINVKTYLALKKTIGFNSRPTQNAPGKENLLELAKDQAVEEDGEGSDDSTTPEPAQPPAQSPGPVSTGAGGFDLNALIEALTMAGMEVRMNTVSKSTTTISIVDSGNDAPPADDPSSTDSGSGDEPTSTDDAPSDEPTDTPTDDPKHTGGAHQAPGPVEPQSARRSNLSRRRK